LRAAGHGMKVLMIQFMKGPGNVYGEILALRKCGLVDFRIVQCGRDSFVKRGEPDEEDIQHARRGLMLAEEALREGACDMLILDEINVAVDYGVVALSEVLELLTLRPPEVHVVLTGRYAPAELLERADLVSEVVERRHHYREGVAAQPGVEF